MSSAPSGKNKARDVVPEAFEPREVVQMDTIDFGRVFAFTAVDIFSREADVLLRPFHGCVKASLTAQDGLAFCSFVCPGDLVAK